ncbi:MAG: hypothetical protein LBH98_03145 [Chitinispirillales bacterium]|jgi:hypothetical protein|nr:hypothetical protein [Chitinispirillales bacterium]
MRQKVVSWTELDTILSYKDVREISKLNDVVMKIENELTQYEINNVKDRTGNGAI